MKVVAVYSGKGGVGKTTTAVNLGYLAAHDGLRTLLWDLDPQAAATYLFRVKPQLPGGGASIVRRRTCVDDAIKGTDFDGLDLLPADATYRRMDVDLAAAKRPDRRLRRVLGPVGDDYDLVFLDTPPSVSLVSENLLYAADSVLVPLTPAAFSVRAFDQLTELVGTMDGRHRPLLHGFFSMADRRRSAHRDVQQELAGRADVASTAVPLLSLVEQMPARRAPVTEFAPASTAATAYRDLWAEVAARFGLTR